MDRMVGTVVRGLRAPIFKEGDDVVEITIDTLLKASELEEFSIKNNDVLTITESVVARAQGNYASIDSIAEDIYQKFNDEEFGVVFPILSRNRFGILLKGISKRAKKIYLMLSYPADEVGNHLVDRDVLDIKGVNPWSDV